MTTRIVTRKGIASLKTMTTEQLDKELRSAELNAVAYQVMGDNPQANRYLDWAIRIQKEIQSRYA